jgi:DnaK suppressor protein
MTTPTTVFEPSFLAIQRTRLVALRTDLSRTTHHETEETSEVLSAGQGQANETEDHAQDLTIAENDRIMSSQLGRQRIAIDRALAKIDEGTYGFSDVSGLPISVARLQVFPQALLTIAEELEPHSDSHEVPGLSEPGHP